MLDQNTKVVRYVPEHAMGAHKFRTRKRVVKSFIPTAKQRERALTSHVN